MAWPTLSSTYNSVWVRMLRIWRCLFFSVQLIKQNMQKLLWSSPHHRWNTELPIVKFFSRMNWCWLCLRFKTESIEDQLWGLSYPIQITFMKNEEKGKQKCGAVEANFDLLQNTTMVRKKWLWQAFLSRLAGSLHFGADDYFQFLE